MGKQLFFEDIETGSEIGPLVKRPTTRQLVIWAGASGDYNPIHYDQDFARGRGLPGVIVQGQLVGSFLGELVTAWMGDGGTLRKLSCSYKGMNYPGEAITCRGKISRKYVEGGQHRVECSLWAENPGGEKTVTGAAIIIVPSRSKEE